MIRGFFRLIGLLLLAIGFIFLIYDGARTIADQRVRLTRLGEFWNDVDQASQQSVRESVEASAPVVWRLALRPVLDQPAWVVLGLSGIALMLAFRPPRRLIGYGRD